MRIRLALLSLLLLAAARPARPGIRSGPGPLAECPGTRLTSLFGLLARPLTIPEMVAHLERGCLALDDVRFRPGQDTIELISPARFVEVARALGMAQGIYQVSVPPEAVPGWPPDTTQARRRGIVLRDELVHYGASHSRLRDGGNGPWWPQTAAPGTARPMLLRIP